MNATPASFVRLTSCYKLLRQYEKYHPQDEMCAVKENAEKLVVSFEKEPGETEPVFWNIWRLESLFDIGLQVLDVTEKSRTLASAIVFADVLEKGEPARRNETALAGRILCYRGRSDRHVTSFC